MKYIERHIGKSIIDLSKSWSAILLTGSRQSGKTTLLKELAERENIGRKYVSLDDLNTRDLAKNDPALFLQIYKPPVLIDEVQYAPELFTYIKIHIDEKHNPGDFWLTGSQVFSLMEGIQESLAGRIAILHLSPLSQREILGYKNSPFTLNVDRLVKESETISPVSAPDVFRRIWSGCMPGLASGQFPDRYIYYSSYISTYIERDVRELSGEIDALKFNRFISAVAARTAQLINYAELANDADINHSTAKSWLNILEKLGIIFLLQPYSNNVLTRTIKTPKVYFYDTGLVCYLTKWTSPEVVEAGAMSGALIENFTVSEIVKSYQNAALQPHLYFYRDKDVKEIDLIMESDGTLYPLEIKKTAMPDKRIIRTFKVIDKAPLKKGTGAVLCLTDKLGAFDSDNLIVPIWMI